MNDLLIQQLTERAKIYTNAAGETYKTNFKFEERFAKLIIDECVSMCDETQANYLKHRKATIDFAEKNIFAEGEAASDVIKYKMKKHFGIE